MPTPGYDNADFAAAGVDVEGTRNPDVILFTAEDDIKTVGVHFATNTVLPALSFVMFDVNDELIEWDGATGVPYGVTSYDVDTTGLTGDATMNEVYVGGCFNPARLRWPVAIATYKARIAALAGATFRIKRVL